MIMLPKRPLTNFDLEKICAKFPFFRGVFMRNNLPKKPREYECGIINLDDKEGKGSHWVAYVKCRKYCEYYDSFGNLAPPVELVKYLSPNRIFYNVNSEQKYNETNCGQLCVFFILNFWNKNL